MACIYKDELTKALSSGLGSSLEQDAADAVKMINTISEYIQGRGTQLDGDSWNISFAHFESFKEALSVRQSLSSSIWAPCEGALNDLISYMGDYEKLDSSMIDQIKKLISECQNAISALRSDVKATNEDGTAKWSDDEKKRINSRISTIQKNLEELKPLIEKLEGLDAAYSAAEAKINGAFGNVSKFESQVNQIQPSHEVKYVPAS